MELITREKHRNLISEEHIIKFFDNETHAESLLNNGEMLFRPLKHFTELEEAGR